MGDSNCALDDCLQPSSRDSPYCQKHKHVVKYQELAAAAKTIFPISGKYRLIDCNVSIRHRLFWIRYEVKPAGTGGYDAETDTIEIKEIYWKDLARIKAEMQSALAKLRERDQKEAQRRRESLIRRRGTRSSPSRQNRWLPSNDDDINSVDGGPPSEASDDDG